jgi:hypothetical protein
LVIASILNCIILGLRNIKLVNFASPKWVYMLKLVEKWLSKTRKYKTVAGGSILSYSAIFKFWKNITSTIFFFWIDVFKSKVLNDLNEYWLIYGTCMSGGHLKFIRHFKSVFLWENWKKWTKNFVIMSLESLDQLWT